MEWPLVLLIIGVVGYIWIKYDSNQQTEDKRNIDLKIKSANANKKLLTGFHDLIHLKDWLNNMNKSQDGKVQGHSMVSSVGVLAWYISGTHKLLKDKNQPEIKKAASREIYYLMYTSKAWDEFSEYVSNNFGIKHIPYPSLINQLQLFNMQVPHANVMTALDDILSWGPGYYEGDSTPDVLGDFQ